MSLQNEKAVIEEILKSKSFGKSTTYANLFRYLIKCTIANEVPKETTIAAEIFNKKNFDPSQSTLIRVYVYNLRKKLKTYYENEGTNNKNIITIPKGGYAVEIIKHAKNETTRVKSSNKKLLYPSLGLLILLICFCTYLYSINLKSAPVTKNELWSDLISSDFPKTLILGDLFIFNEYDTKTKMSRTIRRIAINSKQEFDTYKQEKEVSNIQIEPLTYTHLILGSTHWIKDLSQIFYSINRDFTIRTMSRFNPKQLQEYDILVVGMHKTLGVFRTFHKNSMFEYDLENDAFMFNKIDGQVPIKYSPTGIADSYHTDYGIMSKYPGPNNNSIYLFSGIWDTGATQSLKNFTNKNLVSEIEKQLLLKYGLIPKFYEILIEVKGIDRMELSSKILFVNRLDKNDD